jgi:hypothetical protein
MVKMRGSSRRKGKGSGGVRVWFELESWSEKERGTGNYRYFPSESMTRKGITQRRS